MSDNIYFIPMVAAVVIAGFSQVLLKKGASRQYSSLIFEYVNPFVISGYGLLVMSTVLTTIAYMRLDYKNGPVVEALGFPLVMILSKHFFGEKISRKKVLGNLIIVLGIVIFYL